MTDLSSPLSPAERKLLSTLEIGPTCPVGLGAAVALLEEHYAIAGEVSLLTGELDENFRVKVPGGNGAIFKIFGLSQADEAADLLAAILSYLERTAPDLAVPRLIADKSGEIVRFRDQEGQSRCAILYSFLPGKPLMDARRQPAQYQQCGALLAIVAQALRGFRHPAMHRPLIWDLRNVPALRGLLPQIADLPFASFVRDFLEDFTRDVTGPLAALPHQFAHNDFNARNIIVDAADEAHVSGIIDFGDAIHTARIADVAVGVMGQLSTPQSAALALAAFVAAYESVSPLEAAEKQLLPRMVAARIVQNVVLTSWYRSRQPEGEHFAAFDADYFAWRIDFAKQLCAGKAQIQI